MNTPDSRRQSVTPPPTGSAPPGRGPLQGAWLPKFGIAEMMLAMMVLCVMAAAGSYLRTAMQNDRGRPIFVLFTLASPFALVLVLSTYMSVKRWLRGR